MKVLLVGGGGREHSLAWRISQSPQVDALLAAPGNPGIAEFGRCHPVRPDDAEGLLSLAVTIGAVILAFWTTVCAESPKPGENEVTIREHRQNVFWNRTVLALYVHLSRDRFPINQIRSRIYVPRNLVQLGRPKLTWFLALPTSVVHEVTEFLRCHGRPSSAFLRTI